MKVGDKLLCKCSDKKYISDGKTYKIIEITNYGIWIINNLNWMGLV